MGYEPEGEFSPAPWGTPLETDLTGLLIALTRIGQGARLAEPASLALFAGAALALIVFLRRQFRVAGPVMAPDLLTNPRVLWGSLASALAFFALIGGAVMLPLALLNLVVTGAFVVAGTE